MKKLYESELTFDLDVTVSSMSANNSTHYLNKKEFTIYPNKCLISSGNRKLKDSMAWAALPDYTDFQILPPE